MTNAETGEVTGTKDKNYNLLWFAETCLNNALRLQTYIQDAKATTSWPSCSAERRPTAAKAASRARNCWNSA